MGEIKFRAQDFTGTWQYGFVVKGNETAIIIPVYKNGSVAMGINFYVKPETVGRYTGLKDKNGKEIYEGDIVELRQPDGNCVPCEVSFCEKGYWAISFGINERVILGYINRDQIEVIGNVHDNPDIKMHYSDRYGYKEK